MGRLEIKKHLMSQNPKSQNLKKQEVTHKELRPVEEKSEEVIIKEKKFYEMPWFWVCVTIIIVCLTRPLKIVICGNGNGCGNDSGNNNGNDNGNNNGNHNGANKLVDEWIKLMNRE